ncbi:MAG: transposase, partial [Coleofasciculus sp. C2-GNP5-27]
MRLPGFDYGQSGAYFVTLCTRNKECWFGEIRQNKMHLNQLGKIVAQEWLKTPKIRPETTLDEWIIMPNHIHGIIIIQQTDTDEPVGAHRRAP